MAGEVLLINPRRRRARRKRARAGARKRSTRRRRRNPFAINPRRRRRRAVSGRRTRRGRARRNPRLPLLGNVNITAISGGFFGYLGTRYATTWAVSFLPVDLKTGPNASMVRVAAKAVIGFAVLPMLAKAFRMRGVAGPLIVGAGISVLQDIVDTWLPKVLPLPEGVTTMSDYEQGYITAYEPGQITDVGADMSMDSAYGGGAY